MALSKLHTFRSLIFALAIHFSPVLLAQGGFVQFSNTGAIDGVRDGLTGQLVPAGRTFLAALYFAPDGIVDESQFVQLGNSAGFIADGIFYGGFREAPISHGGTAMFQVRAWEAGFGSTYEEALANVTPQNGHLALAGKSGIMRVDTANIFDPPESLVGLRSVAVVGTHLRDGFTLYVVPEPSTLFLLLAGALGMLLFRRFR